MGVLCGHREAPTAEIDIYMCILGTHQVLTLLDCPASQEASLWAHQHHRMGWGILMVQHSLECKKGMGRGILTFLSVVGRMLPLVVHCSPSPLPSRRQGLTGIVAEAIEGTAPTRAATLLRRGTIGGAGRRLSRRLRARRSCDYGRFLEISIFRNLYF